MFKYWAIKKYTNKLRKKLKKRYGEKQYYSGSQVRSTVYHCNFNPKYLPLGYILHLSDQELKNVLGLEYPTLCVRSYKQDILSFLNSKNFQGKLPRLIQD
ncbi:DUF6559 family protein [Thalassotalea agarivorans]|uniref:Uncharacterized protein n=1 Tax=Thalassotalea agarivorans TaxID=349064 RepID=A0A1I0DIJ9_THASX|nr:DUF6559 family protein [Thalassotalea agarivorans]SET31942.1 hypothetical protein SAMN05660429_01524 [Thalassotalea agarivorans]